MKAFAQLFTALDRTNRTNEKVRILANFFSQAADSEKLWTLSLLSGRRPRRPVSTTRLRAWAAEEARIPAWLFEESYSEVGDLAETIALLLPPPAHDSKRTLPDWIEWLESLRSLNEEEKRSEVTAAWNSLPSEERFVFNKLITGSFRVGVSQALVVRALSESTGHDQSLLAHKLLGNWSPRGISFREFLDKPIGLAGDSRPYPFFLAHQIDRPAQELGPPSDWLAEWKWDGIRGQLLCRGGEVHVWSRGDELLTERFPELAGLCPILSDGTVLDGEILPFRDIPLDFSVLQTRIGRKQVSASLLRDAPVAFMAYDIIEYEGNDLRSLPLSERRERLEELILTANRKTKPPLHLSPALAFQSWDELDLLRQKAREHSAEGLMLKNLASPYEAGRRKGSWWKWKANPLSVDAVLLYAQRGHGRRSGRYTDYTFGVHDGDQLVPFAKAYSGLTDAEIQEVDRFIRQNTLSSNGPVRVVKPELVFEIGFENIALSKRHRAGVAVRFPRILRWRQDKPAAEADTLENLKALIRQPVTATRAPEQLELF